MYMHHKEDNEEKIKNKRIGLNLIIVVCKLWNFLTNYMLDIM